jgi:hypothetical protein
MKHSLFPHFPKCIATCAQYLTQHSGDMNAFVKGDGKLSYKG